MVMDTRTRAIVWFDELGAADTAIAGGKGANLGELTAAGFPVPPGFVIPAAAYLDEMERSGARAELARDLAGADPLMAARWPRAPAAYATSSAASLSAPTCARRSWTPTAGSAAVSWPSARRRRARTPRAPPSRG